MLEPGGVLYIVGQILDNSRLSPLETVVGNMEIRGQVLNYHTICAFTTLLIVV